MSRLSHWSNDMHNEENVQDAAGKVMYTIHEIGKGDPSGFL